MIENAISVATFGSSAVKTYLRSHIVRERQAIPLKTGLLIPPCCVEIVIEGHLHGASCAGKRSNVDASASADICASAGLPTGEIRLIVGDSRLDVQYQGFTVARDLVHHAANIWGLEAHMRDPWDCGVVIGPHWASRQVDFPAYFAYLLGHEFGHATTVLTNLGITIYEDLLTQSIPRITGRTDHRWDEFPHEVAYDQFGLAIAVELFGRPAVEEEFGRILSAGLSQDEPRLRKILTLEPQKDLRDLCSSLAEFARPYKEQLLEFWQQHRGRIKYLDQLSSLDAIWNEC